MKIKILLIFLIIYTFTTIKVEKIEANIIYKDPKAPLTDEEKRIKKEEDSYSIKIIEKILSLNKVFNFDKNNKDINIGKNNDIILSLNGINLEKYIYESKKEGKYISYYTLNFKITSKSMKDIEKKFDIPADEKGFLLTFIDDTRSGLFTYSILNRIFFIDNNNKSYKKITKNIYDEYKKTKKLRIVIRFEKTDTYCITC